MRDKFIQGHWDTMDETSKQTYLEQRTIQIVVRTLAIMCVALLLGAIALEPSCEAADTETAKQSLASKKLAYEKEKAVETMPSYQMRHAYETCIAKCFNENTQNIERVCPQQCGASVKMLMTSGEKLDLEDLALPEALQ